MSQIIASGDPASLSKNFTLPRVNPMPETVTEVVRSRYGNTAISGLSSNQAGVRAIAEAFGYSPEELTSIPAEANMGLSCGNPTASASLGPGEVVVDLGCGGGLDVFLAAQKVGPTGRAIGIDMTPQMIDLARRNATKSGVTNVEFHLGMIDAIPLPDASVDVIVSNCVINLATDKQAVFCEMLRVLKPGGRVAISDIALKQSLPPELAQNLLAYVACIAGAISVDAYQSGLMQAGFSDVAVIDSNSDLNAYAKVENQAACCAPQASSTTLSIAQNAGGCCNSSDDTGAHDDLVKLIKDHNLNDYAASVKVFAIKA